MNTNEIIELARSYLDESSADYASGSGDYSDTEILLGANKENEHLFTIERGANKDWFLREHVFDTKTTKFAYHLPIDCVNPRRVEMIDSGSITGTFPFYVVNEGSATIVELSPQGLNYRGYMYARANSDTLLTNAGYYLADNKINFFDSTYLGSAYKCRLFYSPTAPELHRSTAQAGGSDWIQFGLSTDPQMLGKVMVLDNYYKGMLVEIISGTGAGQIKWVEKYVGSTKTATVDSSWATSPDSTSIYCIVSPIIKDYQELLALGSVIRLKGIKTEDDPSVVAQLYSTVKARYELDVKQRGKHGAHRVRQTNWE